jgi:hypothetical protein
MKRELNKVFRDAIRAAAEADKALTAGTRAFRRSGTALMAKIRSSRMPKQHKSALLKTIRKAMRDL